MTANVADEATLRELSRLKVDDQFGDLRRRIKEGSVDPMRASQGLQAVIENRWDKREDLPYANERVPSTLDYPQDFRYRTPAEQLEYWRAQKATRKLDANYVPDLVKRIEDAGLPAGMAGIGIWPKFSRLGGLYKAVNLIFCLISASRDFNNYRGGEITSRKHWRHTIQTAGCLQRLDEYQPGDYMVVPVDFGKFWAGASIRHWQVRCMPMQFGLCPFTGGCLLLTHPNRITGDGQLYLDLGGCEWSPLADGDFYCSAHFDWCESRLDFGSRDVGNPYARCGVGVASVPQC